VPAPILADVLVHPNLHVALVHFPLGLLITGLLIEVFSFLGWRRSAFRAAGRWMILLGAMTAIPAALSGAYALHQVTVHGLEDSDSLTWHEVATQSPLVHNSAAWARISNHTLIEAWAAGIALIVVVKWIGASDDWRRRLYIPLLLAMIFAVGLAGYGAHLSGEAVFVNGVAVQQTPPANANIGFVPSTLPSTRPSISNLTAAVSNLRMPTTASIAALGHQFDDALPPLQNHLILAGFAVALGMVSIGLSFRAATAPPHGHNVGAIAAALGGVSATGRDAFGDVTVPLSTPVPDRDPALQTPLFVGRVPAARMWLVAFIAALLTGLIGLWMLANDAQSWNLKALWDQVFHDSPVNGQFATRTQAHVICGSAMIFLPLLLALFARFAPRRRMLLAPFAILLGLAIVAQIWLGILLLFDTSGGPLMHFIR
jgi:uncharacterized membrane protein